MIEDYLPSNTKENESSSGMNLNEDMIEDYLLLNTRRT